MRWKKHWPREAIPRVFATGPERSRKKGEDISEMVDVVPSNAFEEQLFQTSKRRKSSRKQKVDNSKKITQITKPAPAQAKPEKPKKRVDFIAKDVGGLVVRNRDAERKIEYDSDDEFELEPDFSQPRKMEVSRGGKGMQVFAKKKEKKRSAEDRERDLELEVEEELALTMEVSAREHEQLMMKRVSFSAEKTEGLRVSNEEVERRIDYEGRT
jgi:hypothetical protein